MKFGASSWPFQWDPPYEDAIRRVAGVGFKAIELIAWNVDFLENYWTKSKIADMKKELRNSGISLSQFVHTPHDLSHADNAKRQAAVADWKKAVEVGAELGSPIINMVSSHPFAMRDTVEIPRITTKPLVQKYATKGVPRGVDWDQNFKDYVDAMRLCAEACGKAGVMMSVEPHSVHAFMVVRSPLWQWMIANRRRDGATVLRLRRCAPFYDPSYQGPFTMKSNVPAQPSLARSTWITSLGSKIRSV